MAQARRLVAVCGATGAQGDGVVDALLADGEFAVRGLTRNPQARAACCCMCCRRQRSEVVVAGAPPPRARVHARRRLFACGAAAHAHRARAVADATR
jgi:hypothetical protein